jgi:hypothetical protein
MLINLIQSFCRVASDDDHLFMRFDFWMRHKNHSEQRICANVELVRFRVLAARPARQTSKGNSGPSKDPSSAHPEKLDRFLQRIYVEPKSVSRRADTVEAKALFYDLAHLENVQNCRFYYLIYQWTPNHSIPSYQPLYAPLSNYGLRSYEHYH